MCEICNGRADGWFALCEAGSTQQTLPTEQSLMRTESRLMRSGNLGYAGIMSMARIEACRYRDSYGRRPRRPGHGDREPSESDTELLV